MEPLDDKELNQLLHQWEAPSAPPPLRSRVFPSTNPSVQPEKPSQQQWWRWLMTGTIRIPVPLALAAVLLLVLWIGYSSPRSASRVAQPGTVSLGDFQ